MVDYYLDGSTTTNPKKSRYIFDGNINVDASTKRGSNYKIRITNHIRNLVKSSDYKNVQLGVVVTESIDVVNSNILKNSSIFIKEAPKASVMNPLGTVIYGGRSATLDDKKVLKLEIIYTKTK